jgi:hypothetical protein
MSQRFAFLIAIFFLSRASLGQSDIAFAKQHSETLAANPTGLHFKIVLDGDQTSFHIGQTIRIKYELTADSPDQYVAGARFLDHGQRSVLESFLTDRPADARDPLQDFWVVHDALDGHLSAPREPNLKLNASPQFDSVELTHYLRFSKPGRYRLYAVTRSVLPRGAPIKEQGGPPLASENVLTFQILPRDVGADSREIDDIVARAHQQPLSRFTPLEAFRLFEIGTPQARKVSATLYTRRNPSVWSDDIVLATILAAPTRAEAIALLRKRLQDTSLVADENLITELSLEEFLQQNPKVTADAVRTADRAANAKWRAELGTHVAANWQFVAATIERRSPDIRASTLHSLDHLSTYYFGLQQLPISLADRDRIRSLHLAAMPDLPYNELDNDLLNFRWSSTLPSDQVLAMLTHLYSSPPPQNPSFTRDVVLKEINKLDPKKAQDLFREHVLDLDTPLDWNRLRSMNLSPSPDLDAELIRILEDRWTDRMSRIAPIIGLYATDAILPRVTKVYEVHGPDWPCSIEAGLLTYFLRVDPQYGTEKLGPALSSYYDKGGSDCHQGSLLVDLAILRNSPELRPFAVSALNDARPLAAAAGARVLAFGDQGKIPLQLLLPRLHALHDEWPNFDTRYKTDADYTQKWNSGYNELETTLAVDFANSGDTAENFTYCKDALNFCITDACRKTLGQRLARSKF